ncbi:serine/arginine-rich splicing factor 7 [Exaiptasia diaphana]|uniref:Uncharacterized protein n=1 Tax=Exaiptasia diaphana TaxID=2652724 RepID=A0A913YML7_EXADI|nr:serine/arginine-rich splicing factor 7 [Exaiptasia diaphana]
MKRLQQKIDASSSDRPRFTRVPGGLSTKGKPKNPVTWAVNDDLPRPPRSSVPSSGSREQENQQSSTNDLPRRERSRSPARSLSQRQSRRMSSKSPSSSPERPRRSRSRSTSSEVTRRTRSRSPSP